MTEGTANEEAVDQGTQAGEGVANDVVTNEGGQPAAPATPSIEDQFKEWAAGKGRQVENLDDLFVPVEKVVEKVVDPWEGVISDRDKAYLTYKKETGRDWEDYQALQKNWDETPALELARERVKRDTGLNLSADKIDEYLEEKLGVDLSDLESAKTQIELSAYTKALRDEKKAEQEKYKLPAENKTAPAQQQPFNSDDYVTVGNSIMKKADFEAAQKDRERFIEGAKAAADSVTQATFKVTFDDKGTQVEKPYTYEYSNDDRHSMVSAGSDLNGIMKNYVTDTGFDHKRFNEDVFWLNPQNREKAFASVIHKAIAENTMEVLGERGNVNFDGQPRLQQQTKDGVKTVSVADLVRGTV